MDSLCNPCITTTHLSDSALSLKLPPPPCALCGVTVMYTKIDKQLSICSRQPHSQTSAVKQWHVVERDPMSCLFKVFPFSPANGYINRTHRLFGAWIPILCFFAGQRRYNLCPLGSLKGAVAGLASCHEYCIMAGSNLVHMKKVMGHTRAGTKVNMTK